MSQNLPTRIFYDRRGNIVTPDAGSIIKPRRGVFTLAVAVNAVSYTHLTLPTKA